MLRISKINRPSTIAPIDHIPPPEYPITPLTRRFPVERAQYPVSSASPPSKILHVFVLWISRLGVAANPAESGTSLMELSSAGLGGGEIGFREV